MNAKARGQHSERGQSLVLFALMLVGLMGFVALAIDVGTIFQERRSMQNAADAAALAAASQLPATSSLAYSFAQDWASKNGFGPGSGATLSVVTPYNGDGNRVEVSIDRSIPTIFARVLGLTSFDVKARAVATGGVTQNTKFAVIALNPSACGSFTKTGSGSFSVTGGGAIAVDSSCKTALTDSGPGALSAAGGIYYYSPGGYSASGNISPIPLPMTQPVSDPMAGLTPPNLTSLGRSLDSAGTASSPLLLKLTKGNRTLHPGVYYGGISISSTSIITLEPGIYVMAGGGFGISGGAQVVGNGVMIYSTYDPQRSSGAGACGTSTFAGGSGVQLTAMTSGTYANVLFWQDKACTNVFTLSGNGQTTTGIFYTPSAQFKITGTAELGGKQIIADTIVQNGNANASIDAGGFAAPVQNPIKLVE